MTSERHTWKWRSRKKTKRVITTSVWSKLTAKLGTDFPECIGIAEDGGMKYINPNKPEKGVGVLLRVKSRF